MFYSLILQALTPVPLQDDEIAALANTQHAAKQKLLVVTSSPATSTAAPVSTLRTVLTTGLRPQQLLLQPMQPPAYRVVTQTSSNTVASANPATIIPDNDPSLDENLLNILAADGEEDDPMLSPSVSVKTLAGLSQSNTALVLPNTVFSSKPISAQDVGVFLQSSGKSSGAPAPASPAASSSPRTVTAGGKVAGAQFVLPRAASHSSHSAATQSQTLRSLLSSTPENLPVSQTLILSPISSKAATSTYKTGTLVTPPPLTSTATKLSESFLPADISFTSSGERELSGDSSDTMTLTLDDLMSGQPMETVGGKERLLLGPPAPGSDRESELASPGAASVASLASSVRSELTDAGKSEEGDTDKLSCQFPGCLRTFDRPTLLKRHLKVHSGECR